MTFQAVVRSSLTGAPACGLEVANWWGMSRTSVPWDLLAADAGESPSWSTCMELAWSRSASPRSREEGACLIGAANFPRFCRYAARECALLVTEQLRLEQLTGARRSFTFKNWRWCARRRLVDRPGPPLPCRLHSHPAQQRVLVAATFAIRSRSAASWRCCTVQPSPDNPRGNEVHTYERKSRTVPFVSLLRTQSLQVFVVVGPSPELCNFVRSQAQS